MKLIKRFIALLLLPAVLQHQIFAVIPADCKRGSTVTMETESLAFSGISRYPGHALSIAGPVAVALAAHLMFPGTSVLASDGDFFNQDQMFWGMVALLVPIVIAILFLAIGLGLQFLKLDEDEEGKGKQDIAFPPEGHAIRVPVDWSLLPRVINMLRKDDFPRFAVDQALYEAALRLVILDAGIERALSTGDSSHLLRPLQALSRWTAIYKNMNMPERPPFKLSQLKRATALKIMICIDPDLLRRARRDLEFIYGRSISSLTSPWWQLNNLGKLLPGLLWAIPAFPDSRALRARLAAA